MPFKSQAQRRWMYKNLPQIAQKWEKETPQGSLPKRVKPKTKVVDKPIETQTQEEISVNVAPFFETSIESTTEAGGLRKSPQYQEYKQSLQLILQMI